MQGFLRPAWLVPVVLGAGACGALGPDGAPGLRLAGRVLRAPMATMFCVPVERCMEPFRASFGVYAGGTYVAGFQSDGQGRFSVRLPEGRYTVVPGDDAPLADPTSQQRSVRVGPDSLTEVTLLFIAENR